MNARGDVMTGGPLPDIPGGALGALTALVASAFGLSVWLRRFLGRDAVGRQSDHATGDVIAMLREQVKLERERADQAIQALREATEQAGLLRQHVADLTHEVERLRQRLDGHG